MIAASASEYEPEDRSSGKLAGWLDALRLSEGGRRPSFLSLNDSECADDQECWKERSKKERAMSLTHGINLRTRS